MQLLRHECERRSCSRNCRASASSPAVNRIRRALQALSTSPAAIRALGRRRRRAEYARVTDDVLAAKRTEEAPYWSALEQAGGIAPDVHRVRGRLRIAFEFEGLAPRLDRETLPSTARRLGTMKTPHLVRGNLDAIVADLCTRGLPSTRASCLPGSVPSHAGIARCRPAPSDRDRDGNLGDSARRSARNGIVRGGNWLSGAATGPIGPRRLTADGASSFGGVELWIADDPPIQALRLARRRLAIGRSATKVMGSSLGSNLLTISKLSFPHLDGISIGLPRNFAPKLEPMTFVIAQCL